MFVSLYTMSICRLQKKSDNVQLDGQTLVVLAGQIEVLGYGGAYRDRTDDPLLAKQVLSQLS